jgi:hypothetical protein
MKIIDIDVFKYYFNINIKIAITTQFYTHFLTHLWLNIQITSSPDKSVWIDSSTSDASSAVCTDDSAMASLSWTLLSSSAVPIVPIDCRWLYERRREYGCGSWRSTDLDDWDGDFCGALREGGEWMCEGDSHRDSEASHEIWSRIEIAFVLTPS